MRHTFKNLGASVLLLALFFCTEIICGDEPSATHPLEQTPFVTQSSVKPLSEKTFEEFLGVCDSKLEDNGFRDMLVAMGPLALDRNSDFQRTKWEDYPSNDQAARWYREVWEPICEQMQSDPHHRPEFLDWRPLDRFIETHGITGDEPPLYDPAKYELDESEREEYAAEVTLGDAAAVAAANGFRMDVRFPDETFPKLDSDVAMRYAWRLMDQPWKTSEHPQATQWLREVSPLLDLWATAVRKPWYHSYATTPQESLFPGEFSAQRALARAMVIRIMSRIGNSEGLSHAESSNAKWSLTDDLMTLYLVSRRHHLLRPQTNGWLCGSSMESFGGVCIGRLIQSGLVDDAQLAELERQLDTLPAVPDSAITIDESEWRAYQVLRELPISKEEWKSRSFSSDDMRPLAELLSTPPDRPAVSELIHQHYDQLRALFREPDCVQRKEQIDKWQKSIKEKSNPQKSNRWTRFFSTDQERAERVASILVGMCMPYDESMVAEMSNSLESRYRLVRIGIAMQRYRFAHPNASCPETLATLAEENRIAADRLIDLRNGEPFGYRRGPVYYPVTSNRMTQAAERTEEETEDEETESESQEFHVELFSSRSCSLTSFQEWIELPFLLYSIGEDRVDQTEPWFDQAESCTDFPHTHDQDGTIEHSSSDSPTVTNSHTSADVPNFTSYTRDDLWFPALVNSDTLVFH